MLAGCSCSAIVSRARPLNSKSRTLTPVQTADHDEKWRSTTLFTHWARYLVTKIDCTSSSALAINCLRFREDLVASGGKSFQVEPAKLAVQHNIDNYRAERGTRRFQVSVYKSRLVATRYEIWLCGTYHHQHTAACIIFFCREVVVVCHCR